MSKTLIRDGVKEHGGIMASAVVLNAKQLPDGIHWAIVLEKDEELYEDSVQVAEGYKPQRGNVVDVHPDSEEDRDEFCTVTPVVEEVEVTEAE